MDDFISTLASVISTYLNERGLYTILNTITYNGYKYTDISTTNLLEIYKYDPFSMIGHCENTVLGKCDLSLKGDNLVLDLFLGDSDVIKVGYGYKRGSIQFGLHNEELLFLIFCAAQEAFDNALKEIEDYRTKEYGHDD